MGARKLKSKRFLKNTFNRKTNGNIISQLKILTYKIEPFFETSSTNISVFVIAYSYAPTFLNAQERQLSNDVGVSE